MQITKQFSWHCAHRLNVHKGLFYNLHGHTYKMEVTISGKINKNGMVTDFHRLKDNVEGLIVNDLDHACVFGTKLDEADTDLLNWCKKYKQKFWVLPVDYTTAENMSRLFHEILSKMLSDNIKVEKVRVWETDTAYAEE